MKLTPNPTGFQTATHGALEVQKDVEAAMDDGGVGVAVAVSRLFFSDGFLGRLMTNGLLKL